MKTYQSKVQKTKSCSVANSVEKKNYHQRLEFTDNRPAHSTQLKLQEIADKSPQSIHQRLAAQVTPSSLDSKKDTVIQRVFAGRYAGMDIPTLSHRLMIPQATIQTLMDSEEVFDNVNDIESAFRLEVKKQECPSLIAYLEHSWGGLPIKEFRKRIDNLQIRDIHHFPSGNCHGYSINSTDSTLTAHEFFDAWDQAGRPQLLVCLRGSKLAHSAKLEGDRIINTFSRGVELFSCNKAKFIEYTGYTCFEIPAELTHVAPVFREMRFEQEVNALQYELMQLTGQLSTSGRLGEQIGSYMDGYYDRKDALEKLGAEEQYEGFLALKEEIEKLLGD